MNPLGGLPADIGTVFGKGDYDAQLKALRVDLLNQLQGRICPFRRSGSEDKEE
jgi:hypothetical protein